VSILERSKGSTIYASGDIGAVKYLHVPYQNITFPMAPSLSSNSGGIGDVLSNCQTNHAICKGFSITGSNALLYPAIIGLDSTQTGDTYIDPNSPAQFIKEGNYSYSETADTTWYLSPNYQLTTAPTHDQDWFVNFDGYGTGFDAGLDRIDKGSGQMSNVVTVSGLAQCQNACVSNSWCQSITMMGANQCYQRKDFIAQHFPDVDSGGNRCVPYTDGAAVNCRCGLQSGSLVTCKGFTPARDGTTWTGNTSYVKKQYPLSIACPQACSRDGTCVMATFDNQGNCNQYNTPPTNRTTSSTSTSVWNFKNFPR
jgi:hypothetical protein